MAFQLGNVDFSQELKSATKTKRPSKEIQLETETINKLCLGFGYKKITLDFGLVTEMNCLRQQKLVVDNPNCTKKKLTFLSESSRSNSEFSVQPTSLQIEGKSQGIMTVSFNANNCSKDFFHGKISFKVSGMSVPVEVKAVARFSRKQVLKSSQLAGRHNVRPPLKLKNNINNMTGIQNVKLKTNGAFCFGKNESTKNDSRECVNPQRSKKHNDQKLLKILSQPVGIPQKRNIPLTKPLCPSAQKKDEKLLKILNGPVGIPFVKSKPATKPLSFQFGQSSNKQSGGSKGKKCEKKNAENQQNWKVEIKNLRRQNLCTKTSQEKPKNRSATVSKATSSHVSNKVPTVLKKKKMPENCSYMTRKILYDENWADKQMHGLTIWLNHVFYPAEDPLSEGETTISAPGGGTKPLAVDHFRILLQKRRQAKIRRTAFHMLQSSQINKVFFLVDKEVAENKLKVRCDRELHADLGIRGKIVSLIMSYNPVWLRIGFEAVYGEIIPMGERSKIDAGKRVLKKFIIERLLQNPDLSAKFKTSKQGVYGKGFQDAMRKFTLRQYLKLVLFLDKAKEKNILENGPCLFTVTSKIKSSETMITSFAKNFLSGEGDVLRHLSLLGFTLTYKQTVLDEFDYKIDNLASDLRDGVRLCRLIDLLANAKDDQLITKLRVPANSLLQKKYNVKLALKKLNSSGIELTRNSLRGTRIIEAVDIIRAHKENTLELLWKIMEHYELRRLLPHRKLEQEVDRIKSAFTTKSCKFYSLQLKEEDNGHNNNQLPQYNILLKDWARSICTSYEIPIYDFTYSFADGRALCAIVNFYHPELLPKSSINSTCSSLGGFGSLDGKANDQHWGSSTIGKHTKKQYENAMKGELKNFQTFHQAIQCLGSIPTILDGNYCTDNLPDERSVIACLGFVCGRVLESSKEIRAAIKLQSAWKHYQNNKMTQKKRNAGLLIYRVLQLHLSKCRKKSFVHCIISLQRRFKCRSYIYSLNRKRKAVISFQTVYRGYIARKAFVSLLKFRDEKIKAAVRIESFFRMKNANNRFKKLRKAYVEAVTLIAAFVRTAQARNHFRGMKNACIKIQSRARCFIAMRSYVMTVKQIIVLQSFARQCFAKFSLKKKHLAATTIQSICRQYASVLRYQKTQNAVLKIQSTFRCQRQMRQYKNALAEILHKKVNSAATRIQTIVRGYQTSRCFQHLRSATIVLQSYGRLLLTQHKLCIKNNAATIIQSNVRRNRAYRNFKKLKHFIIHIQSRYRMHIAKKWFQMVRESSIKIQAFYRCTTVRKQWLAMKKGCQIIEQFYKDLLMKRERELEKKSAVQIQAYFRGFQKRRSTKKLKEEMNLQKVKKIRIKYAAKSIQHTFRQYRVRQRVYVLQRFARMCIAKSCAETKIISIVTLQSFFRAVLVRKEMPKRIKEARERVEEAARLAAEADRLGNRTAVALNVLLNSSNLSGVKRAIVTLEVSTRLSDICAFKFVEMGAVPIIYKLIRSCNRSEPHRAVLTYALNVLRHTSCYEKANASEYVPPRKNRVETLLELMQTFREQPEVLRQITHLMFHLCQDKSFAKQVSLDRDIMKRLQSILRLLHRKFKSTSGINKRKKNLEMRGIRNLERLIERINTGR